MTDILMPALSPTMEDGVLTKWHIKVGDTVSAGDVIAEIETDKATMEVEAVDEGLVTDLLVAAGTEGVKVNTPIARLKADGEAARPAVAAPVAASATAAPASAPAPAAVAVPAPKAVSAPDSSAPRIFASPLARRLAAQKGVALAAVKGTGPHGRIIAADIAEAKPGQEKPAPTAGATTAMPRQVLSLEQMGIPPGSYDLVPLDGMRRTIARRLTDSFRDVPHFPLNIDLEIDRLLDARGRINGALEARTIKVSVNDLIIKAAAAALKIVPEANASFTAEGIALHHHADIAVAVAIDGGLITPIIRRAEDRSLADIAVSMKDLAERARTRKLKPEEFQGGTFSISNLGMMGIRSFASILNEPQGCILSVGAGETRPVVRGDQLAIATVMSVTLTCDHRVVDGAIGARFLAAFKGFVEDPVTLLA
jgi:pyruvate dehydrogenase E2 component (dihydrolipoamide acetyltransferase)